MRVAKRANVNIFEAMLSCVVLSEIDDDLLPLLRDTPGVASRVSLQRLERATAEAQLRAADVVLAHPGLLMDVLRDLPPGVLDRVRWIQSTWAGVEALARFFVDSLPPAARPIVVRFAGPDTLYGHQMAEWFAMMAVGFERRVFEQALNQSTARWQPHTRFDSLAGKTLGILGFGAIGQHVARSMRDGFGMLCVGLSHSGEAPADSAAHTVFGRAGLAAFLAASDYVLCLLPDTPDTRGMLDGDVLRNCRPSALVLNAGRGSLLSEASILRAVQENHIRGFIGDVWPVEPLPPSSPLWSTPGVIVSPHVAAKPTPRAVARVFEAHLIKWATDGQLPHTLDFDKSY